MSGFDSAREAMETRLSDSSQDQSQSPTDQQSVDQAPQRGNQSAEAIAIAELDKMDKFKLDGQEWTLKDLKSAIMRQKDYTQKTQSLAEERKSFESNKKFYENLTWDLKNLEKNPALIHEFVKVYPQEFHSYAEQVIKALGGTQPNTQEQAQSTQVQRPQYDVQTLSRLERLEKFYNDQEVAKNEREIESTVAKFSEKYPAAADFKELVLSRAYELHMRGEKLNDETWESLFKQINDQVETSFKARYSNSVKKQVEANAKGRDVGAGGGTAGSSPKKFKKLSEVTEAAVEQLTNANR